MNPYTFWCLSLFSFQWALSDWKRFVSLRDNFYIVAWVAYLCQALFKNSLKSFFSTTSLAWLLLQLQGLYHNMVFTFVSTTFKKSFDPFRMSLRQKILFSLCRLVTTRNNITCFAYFCQIFFKNFLRFITKCLRHTILIEFCNMFVFVFWLS